MRPPNSTTLKINWSANHNKSCQQTPILRFFQIPTARCIMSFNWTTAVRWLAWLSWKRNRVVLSCAWFGKFISLSRKSIKARLAPESHSSCSVPYFFYCVVYVWIKEDERWWRRKKAPTIWALKDVLDTKSKRFELTWGFWWPPSAAFPGV